MIPLAYQRLAWILYTVLSGGVQASLGIVYGTQSKPFLVAGAVSLTVLAVLRAMTTNSWVPHTLPVVLVACLALAGCDSFVRPVAECTLAKASSTVLDGVKSLDVATFKGDGWKATATDLAVKVGVDTFNCIVQVCLELVNRKLDAQFATAKVYACDPAIASCDGGGSPLNALIAQKARLMVLGRK